MDNTIEQVPSLLVKAGNLTAGAELGSGANATAGVLRSYEDGIPAVCDLYADLTTLHIGAIAAALLLFLVLAVIYYRQVNYIMRNTPRKFKARTLLLNSAYPIVGVAAVTSILVPKAIVLCDTICHLTFALLAYQFYCLALDYAGGESNVIKMSGGASDAFTMRTPPFFCCCPCLKPSAITKPTLSNLRLMVMQMPVVQGTILVALNVINIEDSAQFGRFMMFLGPFLIASILTGVWGLNITLRMLMPHCMEFKLKGKFLAIQLVLITCKLQPYIVNEVMKGQHIRSAAYPVTPRVITNIIVQLVIMCEAILLAAWASALYKTPTKATKTALDECSA